MTLSTNAIDLILQFEVDGQAGYAAECENPDWPGGASGITIGIGYDLGYEPNIRGDWKGQINDNDLSTLLLTAGLKGGSAQIVLYRVKNIVIPWSAANYVFSNITIPEQIILTSDTFPNSEKLPLDALGGLVSVIYNRGTLIDDSDRRREMLNIRNLLVPFDTATTIPNDIVLEIADQVRSMARLWPEDSDSTNDLYHRRLAEADLIANSIN